METDTRALKYYDLWKREIIEHEETKEDLERNRTANQHYMVENAQLHRELNKARDLIDAFMEHGDNSGASK